MATEDGQKQFYYITRLTTFKSSSDYLQFTLLVFPLQMMVRVIVMVVRIVGRMVTMMVVNIVFYQLPPLIPPGGLEVGLFLFVHSVYFWPSFNQERNQAKVDLG